MILHVVAWVMMAGLAQPWAPSMTPPPDAPPVFRIVAIQALDAGSADASIEESAAEVWKQFQNVPFDTFRVLVTDEEAAPLGIDTVFPISTEYRFHVTPSAYRPDSGEVEVSARIEMTKDQRIVNALVADGVAVPGKALVFRGFSLNGREMAVIMTLVPPDKEQSPSPGENKNQKSQEQPQPKPSEEPAAEQKESGEDQPSDAEDNEQTHDLEHAEALLKSLEEVDRREQMEVRKKRNRVEVRKEWW